MRMIQKNIDVVCTFFAGEPPVPHRFRVKDKNEELHVYRISQVLDTVREKVLGDDIWTYKCQGVIGNQERIFVIQYNLHHARWQLVKI